jgi:glycerol-3-phosphate acyltransferase PlsX
MVKKKGKGNSLTIQTYQLLKQQQNLNFIGNIEGRELFSSGSDVIVCDGFTGNVLLKAMEGMVLFLAAGIKQEIGPYSSNF